MIVRLVGVVLCASVALVVCAGVAAEGTLTISGTLTTSSITVVNNLGQQETHLYDVYRPAGLVGAAPAVFMLHGLNADRTAMEKPYVGAISLADAYHIVAVFPDWAPGATHWAYPITIGMPGNRSDVPFFIALRSQLVRSGLIDGTHVYVIGASNGALMSVELMCDPASSAGFRGYGLISGAMRRHAGQTAPSCPATNRNYAFYASAGTSDAVFPYNGKSLQGGGALLSQQAMIAYIGRRLGCSGIQRWYTNSGVLQHDLETGCPTGRGAKLLTVIGGGHSFGGLQGPPAYYKATLSTWTFLWQTT
jgi:poly(3-hydroxybutyrate) depolymerase